MNDVNNMNSGLRFLAAARRCEMEELEQLAHTVALVGSIGSLVHVLQRERGLSNLLLASQGQRFAERLATQLTQSVEAEAVARHAFNQLEGTPRGGQGARLYNRVAWVLTGLDALPTLRQGIALLQMTPARATAAYNKLVAGLLAVVFEAADGANDASISRLLVALFNLMQGKEFAGQERACGAAAFASGLHDLAHQQQWLHLIDAQERCFRTFMDFAPSALAQFWSMSLEQVPADELERLRRIGCAVLPTAALDPEQSSAWFDACTQRIDAMRRVEVRLADVLRQDCASRHAQAQAELLAQEQCLAPPGHNPDAAFAFFDFAALPPPLTPSARRTQGYGRQLERSMIEMVQEQAQRLQTMSDELNAVRATLNERKLVERAKGLLMARRHMSEDEAHSLLRQTAMHQKRRLVDVAESVLATADLLPERSPR